MELKTSRMMYHSATHIRMIAFGTTKYVIVETVAGCKTISDFPVRCNRGYYECDQSVLQYHLTCAHHGSCSWASLLTSSLCLVVDRENSVMLSTKVSTSSCKDPSPVSGNGAHDRASAVSKTCQDYGELYS